MLGLTPDYTPEAWCLGRTNGQLWGPHELVAPLANESSSMRSNKLPFFHEALSPPLDLTSSIAVLAMLTISGFGCINNIDGVMRAHTCNGSGIIQATKLDRRESEPSCISSKNSRLY